MKKILIPFDGSESAMRAVDHAIKLLKDRPRHEVEVHLLHICEPLNMTTHPDYWRPEVQREHLENGEKTIAAARQAFEALGLTPKCTVQMGYPQNDIPVYQRKQGCTEIIMGTRGMTPVTSFFIGSVATRVLCYAECPVTLVK